MESKSRQFTHIHSLKNDFNSPQIEDPGGLASTPRGSRGGTDGMASRFSFYGGVVFSAVMGD
ncbi:hypothetical protein E4U43_005690, partial [Claviceps pusilla]